MSKPDFYEILGIARNASQDDIGHAYRKLARKYHPDHNPNDKEAAKKFKFLTKVYEVLGNQEKRSRYDANLEVKDKEQQSEEQKRKEEQKWEEERKREQEWENEQKRENERKWNEERRQKEQEQKRKEELSIWEKVNIWTETRWGTATLISAGVLLYFVLVSIAIVIRRNISLSWWIIGIMMYVLLVIINGLEPLLKGMTTMQRHCTIGGVVILWGMGLCVFYLVASNIALHKSLQDFQDFQVEAELAHQRRIAAEEGDADAQWRLGNRYRNGVGVPEDRAMAAKWYHKAAEQGHADAQQLLAWCYYLGNGVPKDKTEAIKWIRKAAEQGDRLAIIDMRLMMGREIAEDTIEEDTEEKNNILPEEMEASKEQRIEQE